MIGTILIALICALGVIISNLYDHIIRLDKQVKALQHAIAEDDLK